MLLFFDTEFTGLHKDTTLISLGIISESGKCFYAKLTDYDITQVDDWISENVINKLELSEEITTLYDVYEVEGTTEEVREALLYWIGSLDDTHFDLVSDVCHYDMVLFVNLFGTAFDLPEFISPCCYDINQDIYYMSLSMNDAFDTNREKLLYTLTNNAEDELYYSSKVCLDLDESSKHNSLYDAIIIKSLYEALTYSMN